MKPKKGDLTKFHRDMVSLCGMTSVDSDGCIRVYQGDAAVLQDTSGEAKMLYIAGDDIQIPSDALMLNLFTNGKQSIAERSWFYNNRDKELALLTIKLMLEVMTKAYEAKTSKGGDDMGGDVEFLSLVTDFAGLVTKKTIKSFKSIFKLKKGGAHKDMGEIVRIVYSKKHKRARFHCIFTDVGKMRKMGITKKDAEIIRDVAYAVLPGLEDGFVAESTAMSTSKIETHIKLYVKIIPHFQKFADILGFPMEVTPKALETHLKKIEGLSAVAGWVKAPGSNIPKDDDYKELMKPAESDFKAPAASANSTKVESQVHTQSPDVPWWEKQQGFGFNDSNPTFTAFGAPQQTTSTFNTGNTGGTGHWSENYGMQNQMQSQSYGIGWNAMSNFNTGNQVTFTHFGGGNGTPGFS